jgi:hypothetical protein
MSPSISPIDFASLMAPVCLALLGEPQEKHRGGMEWRYGARGSLRVEDDRGVFHDHETDQKGGTLKFIECRGGMDKPRAQAWMRDQRIITDQPKPASKRIVATYDYTNTNGDLSTFDRGRSRSCAAWRRTRGKWCQRTISSRSAGPMSSSPRTR